MKRHSIIIASVFAFVGAIASPQDPMVEQIRRENARLGLEVSNLEREIQKLEAMIASAVEDLEAGNAESALQTLRGAEVAPNGDTLQSNNQVTMVVKRARPKVADAAMQDAAKEARKRCKEKEAAIAKFEEDMSDKIRANAASKNWYRRRWGHIRDWEPPHPESVLRTIREKISGAKLELRKLKIEAAKLEKAIDGPLVTVSGEAPAEPGKSRGMSYDVVFVGNWAKRAGELMPGTIITVRPEQVISMDSHSVRMEGKSFKIVG